MTGNQPSTPKTQLLLRARLVMPISQPPIVNGGVAVRGEQIIAVGNWREISSGFDGQVHDLGDVLLLPGLVNAHCHLDYTHMAGQFPPPRVFTDWIKLITSTKAEWGYSEFAESWLAGAKMLLGTGTTTVGDIETIPELLPEVWEATPLRVLSFLEMTGVKSRRKPQAILQATVDRINELPTGRCRLGLSPHAPYSTVPELLRLSARQARRSRWPISIHVAESAQEFEMFTRRQGEMFEWLRRNERNMSDCGIGSPVRHLEVCGALQRNLLAIHANYLADGDVALLARRKVTVVHCPRSHSYFRHSPFPFARLRHAGVNICLGTDSLASVYQRRREKVELNLFEEMREFAACHPDETPADILKMVTLHPARALGLQRRVGGIFPNAFADLIALPFVGKSKQAHDGVLNHRGELAASMIGGQWAIPPKE